MFDKGKVKLGIAPIAWTNDDMPELGAENTFEQCISFFFFKQKTAYEIGNKYPKDPKVLKRALDLRGLTVCNAWFSAYFTTKPLKETVDAFIKQRDFLYEVGARVIGASEQGHSIQGLMDIPIFDRKPHFNEDEWKRLADGLNELGRLAREKDMTLTYHHHMGTGVQTLEEIDRLMDMTEPDYVFLLFDTGHLVFAGEDPEFVLRKYVNRIKHVHLKDIRKEVLVQVKREGWSFLRAVKEGVFTVPGDGMIDFAPLFNILAENDYVGWFVVEAEQDPAKANPFEYALKARNYIREKAGL